MIQIIARIQKLHIAEAKKKYDAWNSVEITEYNSDACQDHEQKYKVHSCFRQGLYPFEIVIFKMQFGCNIKIMNPAHTHKADGADEHHDSENYSETHKHIDAFFLIDIFIQTDWHHSSNRRRYPDT